MWRGVTWCDDMRRLRRDMMAVVSDDGCGAVWCGEEEKKKVYSRK
jgi:hypothetical protein